MAGMTRFRRRGLSVRGFSPATDWKSLTFTQSLNTGVPGFDLDVVDLTLGSTVEATSQPQTVRRLRGWFQAMGDSDEVVGQNGWVTLSLGIGVAPAEAIAASAVPGPYSDIHWDGWMWIYQFSLLYSSAGHSPFVAQELPSIDSRAQRRLEDNHLFFAAELNTATGSAVSAFLNTTVRWLESESSRR